MNCPLCKKKLYAIGENGFDNPIGYACPTTIEMTTGPIRDYCNPHGEGWRPLETSSIISHYDARGARTIINLPENYQIITWSHPLETDGYSTILRFVYGKGYQEVFKCRELPIESEAALLARIKLLALFS